MTRQGMLPLPLTGALGLAGLELNATQCSFRLDGHLQNAELLQMYCQRTGISYSVVFAA